VVQLYLICPKCGDRWRSQAASGRTRCRSCDHLSYLPAAIRRAAAKAPGQLVYDIASGRLSRL
jgi:tRNA(Ile2) C34 agmatinyltransferase TiaS